jgi:hypothetical protein
MKNIRITAAEFKEFCELRQKHRWDWPAAFSTNPNGDIWGFQTRGYTPPDQRENVRGASPLLDQVADIYAVQREECGRFFIDQRGAFFKNDGAELQFVQWDSGGEILRAPAGAPTKSSVTPVQLTYQELLEMVRSRREKRP